MLDQMDVGELGTAGSGSDRKIRQVIVIKSLGNEDEDVEIMDDGDTDGTPLAALAAAAGDATGVGTASKSTAGNTIARVGVDNLVYRRRVQQHTAASIGRRSEPQLVAGEHGSPKYSDASVPKVALEGTSKQSEQMSAKSSGRRARLLAITQQPSKRSASETDPSTAKLASDPGYMIGDKNRADESDAPLHVRREFSPLKRKKTLQDGEKSPPVTVSGKRQRVLILDDHDSDEEKKFERIAAFNEGVRNLETSSTVSARDDGIGPIRSAFPLNAKREVHPRHAEAALAATQNAEKQSFWQWITCTKCKKIRLVNADEELDISSWCCEMNTQNPMYASCSATQEKGDYCKVEERQVSIIESDALEEVQQPPIYPNDVEIERKERAQRKMAWVKLQVDGNHVWWPGLTVKVVPAAVQKIIDDSTDNPRRVVRLFHPPNDLEQYQVFAQAFLFKSYRNSTSHPDFQVAVTEADQYFTEPDMDELSEIRKSETRLNAEGDIAKCLLNCVPHEHAESNEHEVEPGDETRLNTAGDFAKCVLNYVPHERAESNELDVDDPHCSQVSEADEEIGFVEDGGVNQALVENGELLDAGHGDVSILKEDDPYCSPSHGDQMENGMPIPTSSTVPQNRETTELLMPPQNQDMIQLLLKL